jgi:uncharacterized RDD family membrane protein YckC
MDVAVLHQMNSAPSVAAILHLLIGSGFATLWLTNALIQVACIGMVIVASQIVLGTTPGKWLMGIRIVRAGTLEPVESWRYVLRFLAYIPACLPLMIGVFWASFNKQRRGWQDYIAGTVVLNLRPHGWYWNQVKTLYRRWRGIKETSAVEQPMGEPPTE